VDAGSIRADIAGVEHWFHHTAVVLDDAGALRGWLLGERDARRGRVWWWGPFLTDAGWNTAAAALYASATRWAGGKEEELAPDDRNTRVARWAKQHGFHPEEASAVLSYRGRGFGAGTGVSSLTTAHRVAVDALHDR